MPSTHDPGQLLEPSNLLEPIDLTDEGAIGSIHASTLAKPTHPCDQQPTGAQGR